MPSSPVYSQPFILYAAATPNTSFDVPTGFTAVIREIDVYTEVGGVNMAVAITAIGSGVFINFAAVGAAGINSSGHWEGRVVAPEEWEIGIDIATLGINDTAYVGGYLLRNTLV